MRTNRQLSPNQRLRNSLLRPAFAKTGPDARSPGLGVPARDAGPLLEPGAWSIRAALAALFSFELVFVLFLFAGLIKASPSLAFVPVDMTALFFAVSVIAGAFILLTNKVNRNGLLITAAMGAFVTWLIVSLAWTPGVVYAQEKVLGAVLAFWACAGAAVIVAADRARVRRFLMVVLLLAVWFAVDAAFVYATADKRWFVTINDASYNYLAGTVACGAVIAVATLISLRGWGVFKVMLAALLGLFFFILLVAGSRQSLLGVIGVLLLAAILGFQPAPGGIAFSRFQRAVWGILLAAVVAVVVAAVSGGSFTLKRADQLLDPSGPGASAEGRLVMMAEAVRFWGSAPILGHGVGSFPILENWFADQRRHPHNIILEVLSELGLLGLILFGALLVSALRLVKLQRLREDPLFRCCFLLAVFTLARTMVGPDLAENRLFYTMLALLALPAPTPPAHAADRLGSRPNGEKPLLSGSVPSVAPAGVDGGDLDGQRQATVAGRLAPRHATRPSR